MRLEDLQPRCAVRGVHPDGLVTVVSVQWFGSEALELTYKTPAGTVANELLYRHDETRLEVVAQGRPWSFDGDGALFRLVSEAQRIRLAHLFDPLLAIHTSVVDPLPHQITGVYDAMLPRQPLRFLLADDPGAGKTIMAGLLIKELIARGDLERCLIVCPGSLAEQWQDELYRRFQLPCPTGPGPALSRPASAATGAGSLERGLPSARPGPRRADPRAWRTAGGSPAPPCRPPRAPDCGRGAKPAAAGLGRWPFGSRRTALPGSRWPARRDRPGRRTARRFSPTGARAAARMPRARSFAAPLAGSRCSRPPFTPYATPSTVLSAVCAAATASMMSRPQPGRIHGSRPITAMLILGVHPPAGRRPPTAAAVLLCELRWGTSLSSPRVVPCSPSRPRLPPWAIGTFSSRTAPLQRRYRLTPPSRVATVAA